MPSFLIFAKVEVNSELFKKLYCSSAALQKETPKAPELVLLDKKNKEEVRILMQKKRSLVLELFKYKAEISNLFKSKYNKYFD